MGIKEMTWDTLKWKFMKRRLGYTGEEMKLFRDNPRNEEVLSKAPEINTKRIVVEVVESKGCNSQHAKGDTFVFDGAGNLLTEHSPKKICIYALNAISMHVFTAGELMLADVDPNTMRFKHAACFDVGVECGGWGQIVMELRVEDI